MSGLARVDRVLAVVSWVIAGLAVVMLIIGPEVVAEDEPAPAEPEAAGQERGGEAPAADGQAIFVENCGGCHTLSVAGTSGSVGPVLDGAGLDAATVSGIVTSGSGGMPSFEGDLDEAEIAAVAEFVAGASQG